MEKSIVKAIDKVCGKTPTQEELVSQLYSENGIESLEAASQILYEALMHIKASGIDLEKQKDLGEIAYLCKHLPDLLLKSEE